MQSITAFEPTLYRYLWATMQGPSDRWDISYKGALDVLDYRLPYHFLA